MPEMKKTTKSRHGSANAVLGDDDTNWDRFFHPFASYMSSPAKDEVVEKQLFMQAREVLGSVRHYGKPKSCSPSLWTQSQPLFMDAAHTVEINDTLFVMGFLGIAVDTIDGSVQRTRQHADAKKVTAALQPFFETPLTVYPVLIPEDTLDTANPHLLQQLLLGLLRKKPNIDALPEDVLAMWHHPDMVLGDNKVQLMFLPVVFEVTGEVKEGFEWWEVYDREEDLTEPRRSRSKNAKSPQEALSDSLSDMLDLQGEHTTLLYALDIGQVPDVIYDTKSMRDLRNVAAKMLLLKERATADDEPYEAHVEIGLTWGPEAGTNPDSHDVPAIRFTAMVRKPDMSTMIFQQPMFVHPNHQEEWTVVVGELLRTAVKTGWPMGVVKQQSATDMMAAWQEQQFLEHDGKAH